MKELKKQLAKFIQTVDDAIYRRLEKTARERGITVQQLIRAIIVPEWVKQNVEKTTQTSRDQRS